MPIQELKIIDSASSQYLKINKSKGTIQGILKIFNIQEDTGIVLYIPTLNMSAYGDTSDEALEMLKEILDDYFISIMDIRTEAMLKELKKYGWQVHSIFKKRLENHTYIDRDGILKNFELPKETVIKESMLSF